MSPCDSRLAQLGDLLTAMIAVVLTGASNLTVEEEICAEIVRKVDSSDFLAGRRYFGALSRVATKCGVSPSFVCHVCAGTMQSPRVLEALADEIRRIDATFYEKGIDCLTREERLGFRSGGKYRKVGVSVARALGVRAETVMRVAKGQYKSKRIISALREEMRRVEASPVLVLEPPFSTKELRQLGVGGKYSGAYARVARRLGLSRTTVRYAALGKIRTERTVAAIREEMARMDAEAKL